MFKRSYIFLLLVLFMSAKASKDGSALNDITEQIQEYFGERFHVNASKVIVDYIVMPDLNGSDLSGKHISIDPRRSAKRLGQQTLWLKVNNVNQPIKVVVKISIMEEILVATSKLNRGDIITANNVRLENREIDHGFEHVLYNQSDINGMMTTQLVQDGTTLTKQMIRPLPDVQRSKKVEIHVRTESIVIKTSGRAKQDGMIGDVVTVVLPSTGKKVQGVIEGKDLVVIDIK